MHSSADSSQEYSTQIKEDSQIPSVRTPSPEQDTHSPKISALLKWRNTFQQVLPVYIAAHLAFLILTYFATLFSLDNFSVNFFHLSALLNSWFRWDSGQYTEIALHGYDKHWLPAFFPLFPLLERGLSFLISDPFVAGLIISNLAGLGMLVVLYRLVEEDFDAERAYRTVLYISVFPTAFFFAAAYNETLFLFLTLLSFYYMRHGKWWLAGLCGCFATLTRSAGLLLLLPFCYEYLRQHINEQGYRDTIKIIRFDILGGMLIPAGLGVYALYSYFRFHDALAFSHAQSTWHRYLEAPWQGLSDSFMQIFQTKPLSFTSIHNVLDLSACLFILVLLVLCFVGPWKFPLDRWMYGIYAVGIYIFIQLFPTVNSNVPLAAFSRYMLEVFPAFIVLAAIGKNKQFNLYYLTISLCLLSFLLLQFLTGRWMV